MTFPLAPFAPRTSYRGMVTAADELAANAGIHTLDHGGSAADAAVAAAAVMAVTSPHLCGLGGDMLAMVSSPGSEPLALLGIGRAGSGVDANALRRAGHDTMVVRGNCSSVPVPGAVDGWLALHERFGRLALSDVLAPAIALAEEGFTASLLLSLASNLVHRVPGAQELCPNGPLSPGQIVRLPGVARTLRAIASDRRAGFYGGEFGRELQTVGQGMYAPVDFERALAQWCEPLRLQVWGHDLWTVPTPSQGYLTLASAWIAERAGIGIDPTDPQWAHLIIEASRAAGHDRPGVLYDGADGQDLLNEVRLSAAADRINPDRAAPSDITQSSHDDSASVPRFGDGDTTHLCAIDADGLGISLTQSNALDFGSHVVAGSTGIFLHNRGVGFSLIPGHPAELAPNRRPPHTLSPMLATHPDGSLSHLIGAMGGDGQPQIILQLLARLLHGHQDPATAISGARMTLDAPSAGPFRLWWGDDLGVLMERHAPPSWGAGLTDRGHDVRPIGDFDPVAVGCAQIIRVVASQPNTERYFEGSSDPRSPNCAAAVR